MPTNEQVMAEFKAIDRALLLAMVEKGQVTLMAEDCRRVTGILGAGLVNTTETNAWDVLLDYEAYSKYLPGIQSSKVLSHEGNTYVIKFVAGVRVMGVGGVVKYTYRIEFRKPYLDVYDAHTGAVVGFWAVLPTQKNGGIILMHGDVPKDVGSTNIVLKLLVEKLPTAELALNISPVSMLVNRMKLRMEQHHKK